MEEEGEDVDMIRSDQGSPTIVGYGTRVWLGVYIGEGEIDYFDKTYLPMFNKMGVGNEEAKYSPWGPVVCILVEDYQEA